MSYFPQNNYSGSSYRYVITPQMADIYAAQSIYGAATTRSGDTVYGFHNTAGSIYNFAAYSSAPAYTIYDSGGTDTLDASGYGMAQTIDLHPGSFSSIGGLVNNIGIYTTSVIEIAIGGSGNDRLFASNTGSTLFGGSGNDTLTGGNGIDRLIGGAGSDAMTGGAGSDTFVFVVADASPAAGQHDLITDFLSSIDLINFSAIDAIAGTPVLDAFIFLTTAAFSGQTGELNYIFDSSRGVTVIQGDIDGDRAADFAVDLSGILSLMDSDFLGVLMTRVIETNGSTTLSQISGHYFLYDGSGSGPELTFFGTSVRAGQFNPWAFIGAEEVTGGYEIALKFGNEIVVWNTDTSANYLSNSGVLSASDNRLLSYESRLHQDLNGDGTIGLSTHVIETSGSTTLTQVGNNYYLYDGSGSGPELTFFGSPASAGQFAPWTFVAAEQVAGGYDVALKNTGSDQFVIWSRRKPVSIRISMATQRLALARTLSKVTARRP